jgi:hypothetical protein
MSVTYGYDLKSGDDMIAAPVEATKIMSRLVVPGAVLVNILPFCTASVRHNRLSSVSQMFSVKYIPSWVPWFSYKPLIQRLKILNERTRSKPINFVKNAMVRCYVAPRFLWTDLTIA